MTCLTWVLGTKLEAAAKAPSILVRSIQAVITPRKELGVVLQDFWRVGKNQCSPGELVKQVSIP